MSTQRDYYEILGVAKTASADDIQKAYRKLVMEFHPDRVHDDKKKEAEARFKEISEAYAVLSDAKKRQMYDQYGHAGIDSHYSTEDIFRGANFSDIFGGMGGAGGFSSIFEDLFGEAGFDIFGGSSGGRRMRKGEEIRVEVAISLEEAALGIEKEYSYNRYQDCSSCKGSGAQPGSNPETCRSCSGKGVVRGSMGFMSFSQTCPACRGEGKVVKNRCSNCGGQGRVKARNTIKVNIPAGVDTGSVLRLRGEGNWGAAGYGDLYLHIAVRPHDVFKRDGNDLLCKVKVSVLQAILGAEIDAPTLQGSVKMKIPAGTQPGAVFRLKGKGVISLQTKRPGDELVHADVEIPQRLSGRERKLLQDWANIRNETTDGI